MKLLVAPESIKAERTWDDSERINNTFNLKNWCGGNRVGLTSRDVGVLVAPALKDQSRESHKQGHKWSCAAYQRLGMVRYVNTEQYFTLSRQRKSA